MEINEALNLLNLHQDSTVSELDEKYRKLVSTSHPDKGGTEEKMQRLNVAKDVVAAYLQSKTALVPINAIKDIVLAANKGLVEYETKKENTKRAFTRILDINTNKPKRMKRMAAMFGGISAAAIFLGKDLPEKYLAEVGGGSDVAAMLIFTSLSIGVYAAVIWWFLDNKVKRIEQDTEDLEASLNDNVYYVDLIHQIFGDDAVGSWNKSQFENSLDEWAYEKANRSTSLARLIHDVGKSEISKLLIVKGAENNLLEKETKTENKRLSEMYSLSI